MAAPAYFDLARRNLDSTTPAMMALAITRIVVRSMFIDYPSSLVIGYCYCHRLLDGTF